MKDSYKKRNQELTETILAQLGKRSTPELQAFIRQFFATTPLADLEAASPADAASVAVSAFEFFQSRTPGVPKIRLFTPTLETHGWKSTHPVLEILNDDMPFLVDSLSMELMRQGFTMFHIMHPILKVVRSKDGTLQELSGVATHTEAQAESFIHVELSSLPDDITEDKLIADVAHMLHIVRLSVSDWEAITLKARDSLAQLSEVPVHFKREEVEEVKDLLAWLIDRNFIFLGYIEYDFYDAKGNNMLSVAPGSELGMFKSDDLDMKPKGLAALPPEVLHFALVPQLVELTKSNRKSMVHRPVPMDYIGLKRFNAKGEVIGERRFLGLFTSLVYYQSADDIPLIRRKITRTLVRSGLDPVSHDGKALKAILEFFPRDELFQISEDDLYEFSMAILALESRPGVKLLVRRDAFERFVSCMVYVPRERFSTALREQFQKMLETAFAGTVSNFYTQVTDSPLARVHLIIRTNPGQIPEVDVAAVEASIAKIAHLWSDLLKTELTRKFDEKQAEKLFRRYAVAFPASYVNRYKATNAVHDIAHIEKTLESGVMTFELFEYKTEIETNSYIHLKMINSGTEIALSDILPVLEHMGLRVIDEYPFRITPQGVEKQLWIRDFRLMDAAGSTVDVAAVKPLFEDALGSVWSGDNEDDGFNALVLRAGIPWRDIVILRAYAKYLKQARFDYAQGAIEQALATHPEISRNLVALFHARFDPTHADEETFRSLLAKVELLLGDVSNLTEDRIIRRYMDLVQATVRTNFYQKSKDGGQRPVLSFKLVSEKIPDLPLPRPFREIYVYGTRVEGIHLRGGKVARGGLRWSDRPEDYRTEVLGLMKAQMVKNSVIVPVGSKGGFFVKHPPKGGDRDAILREGIACYTLYLQGLLDITDNIVSGKVIPPVHVVRHDDDDPYLVVAADKGTASFSDIANSVSESYDFWLGDAFASGGSVGYDHKKMGITARGGWISVTRHFHEMGVDIDKTDFTVVGIGDMSGDVFGNGVLLSKHIKLVAAFNHLHIFLDPNPDPKTSFEERTRLFHLERSTWKDYNPKLISKGGGVFERSAKSIAVSKEMQAVLGIVKDTMAPDELIRAILMAKVDLLWNGGIGTYVKSQDQTHEEVGDRANNALRINGNDLRCKVVGEGGNLGFTQQGRIEYARNGGRINTDAIDNSAGVDCSDHEVNIKIALQSAVASGKLSRQKRDELLTRMTDDVASLVLKDNILQTQAITIAQLQGNALLESQARLMHALERDGLLDRAIEFLPSEKQLQDLRSDKLGLTRPELAVLLAYSKLALCRDLVESDLPDADYFRHDLVRYFPTAMQETFAAEIEKHPLRREIIATVATNSLINRTGMTFFQGIIEDTGIPAREIAAAYTITRDAFHLRDLWAAIEELDADTKVPASAQAELFAEINRFVEHTTLWFLEHNALPLDITSIMQNFAPAIGEFIKQAPELLSDALKKAYGKKCDRYVSLNVPKGLAERVALLESLYSACDVAQVAGQSKLPIAIIGKTYFELGARLRLGWLRHAADKIASDSYWHRLSVRSIINDTYAQQSRLTTSVIATLCNDEECSTAVDKWAEANQVEIDRYLRFIADLKSNASLDISMLVVAAHKAEGLCSV